ncbi:hypothetical protein AAFC00_006098 [Neodothiora populina]|uniref:Monocarboxylate transporter n=1 Tax=Neodothiora populina TaxID=2781224 RepID=A0ABR3P4G5_9PEZI
MRQPKKNVSSLRPGLHESPEIDSQPPDGGSRAWVQVLGSFFLFFNTWGLVNSFGVYQSFYERDLLKTESASKIAWIGSTQAFLLLIIEVATGPMFDASFFNLLLSVGSFFVVFGSLMTSLCNKYWQVMLAQSVTVGLGSGCLFIPSVAIMFT